MTVLQLLNSKLKYLPVLFLAALFIFLPYCYERRLITSIFNTDFYLFWFTGCACWLFTVLSIRFCPDRLKIAVVLGFIYVLLLFFLKAYQNANSVNFTITFFSIIGIICYLQVISNSKYYFTVTAILLTGFFIQIYTGYKQAFENDFESLSINGQFHNSGFFANYLASVIPLMLAGFIVKSSLKKCIRILFFISFIVSTILLSFTVARAAFVGSVIGCLVIVWPYFKRVTRKKWILFSLVTVIITLGFIHLYKLKPASALGHLTVYIVCVNMIKAHPLFGIGPNRFSAEYNNYQASYFQSNNVPIETQLLADNTYEAFNSVLQILVEYGIIGFLILAWIIYELLKQPKSSEKEFDKNWLYLGSFGCIISIVVSSFFSNPFHVTPVLLILCYHLSVILPGPVLSNSKPKQTLIKLGIVSVFCFLIFYYSISQYKAEIKWQHASELALYDDFKKAKPVYDQTYKNLKFNGDFLFNYGAEASLAGDFDLSIDLLQKAHKYMCSSNSFLYLGDSYSALNQFTEAEKNYLKAIYIAPSHIYPKYQLIQLYIKWNKKDEAKKWILITLETPIKIQSEFTDSLISEIKKIKL